MISTKSATRLGTYAATAAIGMGLLTGTAGAAQAATLSSHAPESRVAAPTLTLADTASTGISIPRNTDRTTTVAATKFRAAANPFTITAKKTAAFAGCIAGVGIPIGLAWSAATNPAVIGYVLGIRPLPASAGGLGYNYISLVKRACAYALR
ncbi:hypothetical protein GS489_32700 [Rhodococcus hoagii]|nr:hypothetical protein [Prescottella equi]